MKKTCDSDEYCSSQFSLADAPPAFRAIRWEVELSSRGLKRLTLLGGNGEPSASRRGLPAVLDRRVKAVKRMLLERLRGGRADFEWDEFDLEDAGPFHRKVWQAMRNIPFGETATYADIARDAGSPLAFRACGQACGANRIIVFIPCHRVVGSTGIGGFGCGLEWKKKFLDMESKKQRKSV